MSIDSRQKRMSAINPACVWRGVLVDATETGFSAGNRAAADYMYSGVFTPTPPAVSAVKSTGFIVNCGMMMNRGMR